MLIYDTSMKAYVHDLPNCQESTIIRQTVGAPFMYTEITMPFSTPTLIQHHIKMGAIVLDENHWINIVSGLPFMDGNAPLKLFLSMREAGADDTFLVALIWITDTMPELARWMGIDDGFRLALTTV